MCASVCAGVMQVCTHVLVLRCVLHAVEASAE